MPKSNDAHRVANVDEDDGEETQDDTHAMTTNELKIEALEALRNTRASANGNIEKARLVRDIVARELVRSDEDSRMFKTIAFRKRRINGATEAPADS